MSDFNNFNNNNNNNNNFNFQNKQFDNVDIEKYKPIIKLALWLIGSLLLIVIVFNSFTFTVNEQEQTIVRQFNEIKKVVVSEGNFAVVVEELSIDPRFKNIKVVQGKGLFFKIPLIQTVESFTSKLLTYDTNKEEVTSSEKRKLVLDNYAQWQIINPVLYLANIGRESVAFRTIDDILYSDLREKIGKETGITIISDKEHMLKILEDSIETANIQFKKYGIQVEDMRIKSTDLPEDNYETVYNRMRTERKQEANTYRYDGEKLAKEIRSAAKAEAVKIEADAYTTAENTKGEGDAEALKIYAEAFSEDVEFYKFWRTLEAYKITMNAGTTIVIDSNSDFAKILTGND